MVAATRLRMSDISRQKRFETGLDGELTPRHSVGQAVEFYLDRMRLPPNELRWSAFARGVKLDSKQLLEELEETDAEWTVMPEVSAGAE
ncbi:MAG TPA: hypothetical protein VML55_14640 [Planctomycetaceae bacterium]|nr:hypothetical protein [Planctomycetaceae bacterium]